MIQNTFIKIYGDPSKDKLTFEKHFMKIFVYPELIQKNIPSLGKQIYCNINFIDIYTKFLTELIRRKLHTEIKTFDGCYNVRFVRGVQNLLSIHSWGMAIDLNAKDNPLGIDRETALKMKLTPFTKEFIQCAEDIGMVAGYNFSRKDGMHFEDTKF